MDSKIKILIISAIILIAGGIVIGLITNKSENETRANGAPELTIEEKKFNFGTISMADGLAKHTFILKNTGTADLEISSIKTSCMCTEAVLEVDGRRSPEFGMHTKNSFWSEEISPNQTANLEVTFNPNAHGPNATGPVTRTVTFFTNDQGKNSVKTNVVFTANVVK